MKDLAHIVAKMRFEYHSSMCSVNSALNQLGIIKDEQAEENNKYHLAQCVDSLEYLGLLPIDNEFHEFKEEQLKKAKT